MTFVLGAKSQMILSRVHTDLLKVTTEAIRLTPIDFAVIEGLRTLERQKALYDSGASHTMHSRHLDGHAIDFVAIIDGTMCWKSSPFHQIAEAFKQASKNVEVPIQWGGDFPGFPDLGHIQLDYKAYPSTKEI